MGEGQELRVLLPPSLGQTKASARAELLADELRHPLHLDVTVRVASSYGELAREATSGGADLVWAPPRLRMELAPRARAVLTCIRDDGPAEYRSALLARPGEVRTASDLQGLRAAWVDRESTGGYRLIAETLQHEGLPPSRLFSSQRFLGSYHAAITAVLQGDADVCAIYTQTPDAEGVARALDEVVSGLGDRLEPIAYTPPSASDAFVLMSSLDEELATRVVDLLLSPRCPDILLDSCNADHLERV